MVHPSSIHPDHELRDFLQGKVVVGENAKPVPVYGNWERPTNGVPDDFVVIMLNGNPGGLGLNIDYAKGYLMVCLYCKLNSDGSVKENRVTNILKEFDTLIEGLSTENYHFKYDNQQFITPTTPNITSGYSVTSLNLRWTTTTNFNKPEKP